MALCYCRGQRCVLGPALSAVFHDKTPPALGRFVARFDDHISRLWQGQPLAAWSLARMARSPRSRSQERSVLSAESAACG